MDRPDMTKASANTSNVVDLFSGKTLAAKDIDKIVRIAPEQDGLEMLYSNDSNPGKLYSMNKMVVTTRSAMVFCRTLDQIPKGRLRP